MAKVLPNHIAIIMDGNGRWANQRRRPRVFGHREGAKRVREIVEESARLGIRFLTLYAFSEENWRRPSREISFLMELLNIYLVKERESLFKNNIKLDTIGNVEKLPVKTQRLIQETKDYLSKNDGLCLTLALSYSGRSEMAAMSQNLVRQFANKSFDIDEIDEELVESFLPNRALPDVDLMIRTSGEQRISNFMLWRLSYAELYFTDAFWPEFDTSELDRALRDFAARDRRFGAVSKTDEAETKKLFSTSDDVTQGASC